MSVPLDLQLEDDDFASIDHFTAKEIRDLGEDFENIQYALMFTLDNLREALDTPFVLHCIGNGKHVENSYHYQGIALDGHFTHYITPNQVVQAALNCGFTGIGYYSWGWHFDLRPTHALWKREGKVYLPMVKPMVEL